MFNTIHSVLERAGIEPKRIAQAAVLAVILATAAVLLTGFDSRGGFTLAVGFFALALALMFLWDLARWLWSGRNEPQGTGAAQPDTDVGDGR